ncbi:ethanolamine utilization protein EutN [Clostridium tetanomorphum]|uniref:EutN/CcmL family microcompartment protein n=1 Tax=Clostridium tetanomorphum TaxID=1553 RepID=A0A923J0L8_CLOTT|nr:EutN/CcmL family microcompartment protein [Clostridium tetanomorphum]KAJ52581.1 ethanolamine utilization protein EutN/carboxysome structural protein Ccml [Clostridium tetanomorphum DSM 665]MBC2396865.1 EutN/CcmL family microcompartment protein [Clostridium tetanomorphum]MBP1863173.1 ethanolamine utilization protein EutN [Clostridium tetanomorphum]NRS84281.1 ethanolamine utilization protein EutN [Clostridium tetanomorphum]NRZ97495.1 ethanolamine utilization protein EutN [Clostridium tetanomo
MIIGEVLGNVWATRKDENLNGLKFLVIRPIDYYSNKEFPTFVAVDSIGAGIGETVLIVQGSSARVSVGNNNVPVDATIVGIIDTVEVEKSLE